MLMAQIASPGLVGENPDAFKWGISRLVTWLGNVILPILCGLFVAAGIVQVANHQAHALRLFTAAVLSLLAAGLVRLFDTHLVTGTFNNPNGYAIALIRLVTYIGNVVLPLYAGFQVMIAVFKITPHGRYLYNVYGFTGNLITAVLCLMVAGLVRLIETLVLRAL
jgi:hypothetical protein